MRFLASFFLVVFLGLPSFAETNGNRYLGGTDFWSGREVNIPINSCQNHNEKITHFLARVIHDHIYIRDTTLHYDDGTTTYFWVDGWLQFGYMSRWIPVAPDGKCLKSITVRGFNNGPYGSGFIQFFGQMIENTGGGGI